MLGSLPDHKVHEILIINVMRVYFVIFATLLMGACATAPTTQTKQQTGLTPEQYYSEARKAQTSGKHDTAITYFSDLEVRYPSSPYAQLVPVEMGYAYYKQKNYEKAANEVDRFIYTYPDHPNKDYGYYLKGLIRAAQGTNKPTSNSNEIVIADAELTRDAYKQFSSVVKNYPDSQYRASSLQHLSQLRNQLARHELQIAKDKLAADDPDGAIRHAKFISEQYANTPAASEAITLITNAASIRTAEMPAAPILAQPSAEVMPTTQTSTPVIKDTIDRKALNSEEWLLQQNPDHFTLQIIGTSNINKLERFIADFGLQNQTAYFHRKHKNSDWYSLLYGNYASRHEALDVADKLKHQLGIGDIWLRQFDEVQASIRYDRNQ